MATCDIDLNGLSAFRLSLEQLAALPDEVVGQMLTEGAEVLAQAQRESAEAHGLRRTGLLIESIRPGRPRRGSGTSEISIAPEGTRVRGRTVTRNAEIAYVNEYGKKGMTGTEFIKKANAQKQGAAIAAAEKIFNEWLDRIGLR